LSGLVRDRVTPASGEDGTHFATGSHPNVVNLRHCTKINGIFIHIPSLTGRLIVAGDIPFYQHSVPDGTGDAATLPQINYKLRINGTSDAATLPQIIRDYVKLFSY
jgi:hypothetical protein